MLKKSFVNKLDEYWIEDMFIYSLRYTLGRMSYSPSVCISFLRPLIPELSDKTLWCMSRDIAEHRFLKPHMEFKDEWFEFKAMIDVEMSKRNEAR